MRLSFFNMNNFFFSCPLIRQSSGLLCKTRIFHCLHDLFTFTLFWVEAKPASLYGMRVAMPNQRHRLRQKDMKFKSLDSTCS